MKNIQILTTAEQIEDACAILYQVYIEKMQWDFSPDNPSNIRIEIRNNKKILVDRFVDIAVWFGIFENDKLVGCIRVQGVDENNKLELEGYESSQVTHKFIPENKEKCVELAKLAILSGHDRGIIKKLFLEVFKYCELHGYSVIGCTHNNFLKDLFKKINFFMKIEHAFKYELQDPSPVNFYFADQSKNEIADIIQLLDSLDKIRHTNRTEILQALEIVAPVLPIPVYWHDREGLVLGLNEQCLNGIGASREIIGKSPYEFYPKETAELILNHNNMVIDTGINSTQEEKINDMTTGETKYYSSVKAPLYDADGVIVGIVGTSINITAEKEAQRLKSENERLEIENQFQNKLIKEQENFKAIIDQAVHDIRSPLASLLIISKHAQNMPKEIADVVSGATKRINDIADVLVQKYTPKSEEGRNYYEQAKTNLQVSLALQEILSEKKYEFYDIPVEFNIEISQAGYLVFLYTEEAAFKRMISNLLNNAVEALEDKPGVVSISLDTTDTAIMITVEDSGKGMPAYVVDKIKNDISITEGKREGYGLGLSQVRDTLRRNDASFDIDSTVGLGTKISLVFPKSLQPLWVADKIDLNNDDVVLILDDDSSIHKAWEIRLRKNYPNLMLKYFESGSDTIQCANELSLEQRERALLLADYELLNQDLNGLDVITQSQIKRSILVTNRFSNREIQSKIEETDIKILPKLFISDVPIVVR